MTRILHTADLHLADGRPERWEALDEVLRAAERERADAVAIAGDLLDREGDHAALRPRVRERFDAADRPVFLLPGNHDRGAYAPGRDWGACARLLSREPVQAAELEDVQILGVPYPEAAVNFRALRRSVAEAVDPSRPTVLLLHGTLVEASDPTIQSEAQDDEPGPYLPVRLDDLAGLDLAYVGLGHYHQHALRRAGGTPVAYAGSPSPVGSHAWGPRVAVVVEIGGTGDVEVRTVELPVPYRTRVRRWITPFREIQDLEALADELRESADPRCAMEVVVDGILAEITEEELRRRTDEIRDELAPEYAALETSLRGVGLEGGRADLFREFRRRLDEEVRKRRDDGASLDEEIVHRALAFGARALKT
ncbi:MAG: metallophosphoesterase family protein [Gemmatimonadota bacterium]